MLDMLAPELIRYSALGVLAAVASLVWVRHLCRSGRQRAGFHRWLGALVALMATPVLGYGMWLSMWLVGGAENRLMLVSWGVYLLLLIPPSAVAGVGTWVALGSPRGVKGLAVVGWWWWTLAQSWVSFLCMRAWSRRDQLVGWSDDVMVSPGAHLVFVLLGVVMAVRVFRGGPALSSRSSRPLTPPARDAVKPSQA